MSTATIQKIKKELKKELKQELMKELHQLRDEMRLFFPQENLSGYSHPERIKKSYHNALKRHSPVFK